jgi:arginine kinase
MCSLFTILLTECNITGKYYDLATLTDEDRDALLKEGYLFQIPKTTNLLWHAGAAKSWPADRGIFHNEAHTALCWVNEEDHCR